MVKPPSKIFNHGIAPPAVISPEITMAIIRTIVANSMCTDIVTTFPIHIEKGEI